MHHRPIKYLIMLSFYFAVSLAAAEEITARSYQLPDNGLIRLQVPQSWRDELRQPSGGFPPTIVFSPRAGTSFQILLTPVFSVRQDMIMPSPSEVKALVERGADRAIRQAIEKTITVKELKSATVIGYYFSATDGSPKPGEYKYMTQGTLRVGNLAPTFTILTNDGADNIVAQALLMLKSVNHVKVP